MGATERDVRAGGFDLRVREAGTAGGFPVVHFHGTPSSRLELSWADDIAEGAGVRLVTFDRPGYGGSPAFRFDLIAVAEATLDLADQLGFDRFATMGQSGGGPFALATAYVGEARVTAAGSASGAGPFQLVPGATDHLWEADAEGLRLLPEDPDAAVEAVAGGLDLGDALDSPEALIEAFRPSLSPWDLEQLADPVLAGALLDAVREAMRTGKRGYAWDNLSWLPHWPIDPGRITCPVHLWYGTEDLMAPVPHAEWLAANIPTARLTMRDGVGHLGFFRHLAEMFADLLAA